MRPGHFFRLDEPIKFGRRDEAQTNRFLAQRRSIGVRCLRDLSGPVISDFWGEGGDEHERALHQFADARFVGAYSDDAIVGEGDDGVAEQPDRLHHAIGEQRLVHVELKMPLAARDRNGRLISEYLAADHRQRFALRRIGLAGHDRRSKLVAWKD